VLAKGKGVTAVDVCVGIGWLSASHVESWRYGRVGSVRHQDTHYDDLLMSGVPRDEARDQIRPAIDRLLATWA
jgi:hypothetical protein